MIKKKVIIFDLDDTLLPSTYIYEIALRAVGLSLKKPSYLQARARAKAQLVTPSQHHRLIYFKNLLETKKRFSSTRLLKLHGQYEKKLEQMCEKFARNLQRKSLLKKLSSRFDLYILTNETLRTQLLKIRSLDPKGKYFKGVLTSEEIGCEKPDKIAFVSLLTRYGLKASQCYFVGDSIENDLVPAHALGLTPILTVEFTGLKKSQRLGKSTRVIASLDELLELA